MTAAEEAWDWDHQQAVTRLTVQKLLEEEGLQEGTAIALDLEFRPTDDSDRDAAARKLGMFGYSVEDGDNGGLRVIVEGAELSGDAIWMHEERTSRIALIHGYEPDGWGFAEP
ncbi:hypothetical protein ACW9UR_08375 [Halovulum sp. GXIMD14794]